MKHFVTLPYLLSVYLTSSGRGFLPLVSWDQVVTPVYIVLTAAHSIQGKEEECMIHIRGVSTSRHSCYMDHYGTQIFELLQVKETMVTKPLHYIYTYIYIYIYIYIYVSLRLRVQNAVSAQPCVGKFRIPLVLLNFLHCNFRLWFETP